MPVVGANLKGLGEGLPRRLPVLRAQLCRTEALPRQPRGFGRIGITQSLLLFRRLLQEIDRAGGFVPGTVDMTLEVEGPQGDRIDAPPRVKDVPGLSR